MSERVETVKAWCAEQVGCPYIYGATGQACTPAYRRARMEDYPKYADKIKRNCPRMNGGATSCAGCKWARDGVGRLAYDCAQLTRAAMKQAGIALVSGANSQWQKTAFVIKGEIRNMPYGMMCLVYREDSDGRKHHTGVYCGDGYVVHAKGHDYGVVRERWQDAKLTHYGIPAGLYSDAELRAFGIDPSGNFPTLRRGSKGELVKKLQVLLLGAGYGDLLADDNKNPVDGIFGKNTENAVRAFQQDNGLTVDGVVGPKTWATMGGAPEDDEAPEAPDLTPDEPEDGAETVSVSRGWLLSIAQTFDEIALDIRAYIGQMQEDAHG